MIRITVPGGWDGPPLHHHDFDETFYVLEGELTFQLGERVSTAGAGEIAFAPRGSGITRSPTSARAPASYVLRLHARGVRALLRPAAGRAHRQRAARPRRPGPFPETIVVGPQIGGRA